MVCYSLFRLCWVFNIAIHINATGICVCVSLLSWFAMCRSSLRLQLYHGCRIVIFAIVACVVVNNIAMFVILVLYVMVVLFVLSHIVCIVGVVVGVVMVVVGSVVVFDRVFHIFFGMFVGVQYLMHRQILRGGTRCSSAPSAHDRAVPG